MDPKKFLFISKDNLSGDIAWQVVKEGHEVKYFTNNLEERDVADGFVPKVDEWESHVDWAEVIVFDDTHGTGELADSLRKRGKAVIGGTRYSDRLEDDRAFGQEEMKRLGISILPYRDFTSFDEAVTFIQQNPSRYVIKPCGEADTNKGLLFIGEEEDGRDVIQVLTDYKNAWSKKILQFQLQKRVVGVEVAIGAFFNGKQFITPINVNFEHKKLFPGNIGPSTWEMGTSMFWSQPNKLFNQTLKKMEVPLVESGYRGYIDINCIVNSHGIYPLEFTCRFGIPTISIQIEGMITPLGNFLADLAYGNNCQLRTKIGFQVGVALVVPPWPYDDPEIFKVKSKDSVIYFRKRNGTKNPQDGVHIGDVKLMNGEWVVTGNVGWILVVTGSGQTMRQAQNQTYNRIRNINIPHMYYRDDIGERWADDSDKLHAWGYLRES